MGEELPNLPMYCSVEWADAFFSSFLWTENWDSMEEKQKTAALKTATNLIQRYAVFYDDEKMPFVFDPDETDIPDLLKEATAKEANYLLSLEESPIEPNSLLTMGIQSANGVVFSKDFQGDIIPVSVRSLIYKMGGEVLPEAIGGNNAQIVAGRYVR